MNIVLLGGPGAGKGTLAEGLKETHKMLHLSTGDLLREALTKKTEQGLLAKKYMEAGNLVPDEVIVGIMKDKLNDEDLSNGLILDGFPRTTEQAIALDKMLEELKLNLDLAVLIKCPDETVISRICGRRTCAKCGHIDNVAGLSEEKVKNFVCPECGGEMTRRADDNEKTVRNRIDVYNKQTAPLIDYYTEKGILKPIDGSVDKKTTLSQAEKLL